MEIAVIIVLFVVGLVLFIKSRTKSTPVVGIEDLPAGGRPGADRGGARER